MRKLTTTLALALVAVGCGRPTPPNQAELRKLQFTVDGEELSFELRPNEHLFAPGFSTYRVASSGSLEVTSGLPEDASCYRLGRSNGATIAVHTCQRDFADLEGVLVHDGRIFDVAMGPRGVEISDPVGKSGSCGIEAGRDSTPQIAPLSVEEPDQDFETRRFALGEHPRFIESIVVTDAGWNAAKSAGTPVGDPIMSAHATAAIYDGTPFEERTLPILTGVVDLGASNPWGNPSNGRVNSSPYLDNFNQWLGQSAGQLPDFDHAALMTGYDMGNIIGLALFESACDPSGSGALVYSIGSTAYSTMTMAHEFGHLIGMDHDETVECPADTFVMTASYYEEGPFPTDFSPCSLRDANAFLATEWARCIDPDSAPASPEPRCGDGKIEGDEQCDCGPDGCDGRDPCCNGATCRLNSGATCSMFDGCCDASTCTPYEASAAVECRPSQGECDVAEVCDGAGTCPPDRVIETGTACTDGRWPGACYLGECITRGGTCEYLSQFYVLDNPPYEEICGVDAGCGPMECYGEGQCLVTSDPTPDGTSCGGTRVCFGGECLAPDALPGADGCGDPDVDRDGDGVADCYDECPRDPEATQEPCADPATSNNGNTNNDGGGASDPTDPNPEEMNPGIGPMDVDEPIVILDSGDDGGCSAAGGSRPEAAWLLIVAFAFGSRRLRSI